MWAKTINSQAKAGISAWTVIIIVLITGITNMQGTAISS